MAAMTVFRGWTLTEQGIAPRQVTVRDGIITAVAEYDAPTAADPSGGSSRWPTTRCCCPDSSTPTCT